MPLLDAVQWNKATKVDTKVGLNQHCWSRSLLKPGVLTGAGAGFFTRLRLRILDIKYICRENVNCKSKVKEKAKYFT